MVVGFVAHLRTYALLVAVVRTSVNQWELEECYCGNKKIVDVQKIISLDSIRPGNSCFSARSVLEHCQVNVMLRDDT